MSQGEPESADLVVGVLDGGAPANGASNGSSPTAAMMLREALTKLASPPRTVLIDNTPATSKPDENQPERNEGASFVVLQGPAVSDGMSPVQGLADGYRAVFSLAAKLNARACCAISSNLESVHPQWFYLLTQPVLEQEFDLVTPCYEHRVFEGLLNSSLIGPLHCALYGTQIQNPMGPDVGLSQNTLRRVLANAKTMDHPLVSLAPAAIGAGLKLCQAYVGTRVYPPTDWSNVSSLLTQILGLIFSDIERNAAVWQRIRGSRPVPAFGEPQPTPGEAESPDVTRLIESFQLGIRDLREVWSLIMPPSTLLDLSKLSRLPQEQFRIPDHLWARIVYDFAIGHRVRTISRDHLLRAMTPLYLGWVASFALETASKSETVPTLDRLPAAFEVAKPYFVSRWRWPDRFNP